MVKPVNCSSNSTQHFPSVCFSRSFLGSKCVQQRHKYIDIFVELQNNTHRSSEVLQTGHLFEETSSFSAVFISWTFKDCTQFDIQRDDSVAPMEERLCPPVLRKLGAKRNSCTKTPTTRTLPLVLDFKVVLMLYDVIQIVQKTIKAVRVFLMEIHVKKMKKHRCIKKSIYKKCLNALD